MNAGSAKIDITPSGSVWMEGMIRAHPSDDVHDALTARALYMADGEVQTAIITLDVCVIQYSDASAIRHDIEAQLGIPTANIIIAASHTHSGPATIGFFSDAEPEYVQWLGKQVVQAVAEAQAASVAVNAGCASGIETTVSHYRRFLSDAGKIVMIWEENPAEGGLQATGESDTEVGVLKLVDLAGGPVAVLFNHAGHPNVMSGDSYSISADYVGAACRILEAELGCVSLFTNGAQGSVDIDNWKWRDWDGVEVIGSALAQVVSEVAHQTPVVEESLRVASAHYSLPRRTISDDQLRWAEDILKQTGGKIQAVADGVGDDFKALLYKQISDLRDQTVDIEQVCIAVGDCAFLSFPGELFTEIGMEIKRRSPFKHTYIVDLANGYVGYVPTKAAIDQGGYEVDTRSTDSDAEQTIINQSLHLLNELK